MRHCESRFLHQNMGTMRSWQTHLVTWVWVMVTSTLILPLTVEPNPMEPALTDAAAEAALDEEVLDELEEARPLLDEPIATVVRDMLEELAADGAFKTDTSPPLPAAGADALLEALATPLGAVPAGTVLEGLPTTSCRRCCRRSMGVAGRRVSTGTKKGRFVLARCLNSTSEGNHTSPPRTTPLAA